MGRVYLDSCLIIYLVERHPEFSPVLREKIAAMPGTFFAVSALTRLEVLAMPKRCGNDELVSRYEAFLSRHEHLFFSDTVFELALDMRVRHGVKTPEALHLAVAKFHGCGAFWSNDDRLVRATAGWATNMLNF